MKEFITGYQYGDNMRFSCVYVFPNNLDKDEIHVPPRTTLIAPPSNIAPGKEAMWTGQTWVIVATEPLPANPHIVEVPSVEVPSIVEEIANTPNISAV